jgi:tRNA (pseudouridine54-N1)-methyltransferase
MILREAGRLDVVCECIVASFFMSHRIRREVGFHAFLNGPPTPPVHLEINGRYLRDVRTDQATWKDIFKRILSGYAHPGIHLEKKSFEKYIREKAEVSTIYVLEERGRNISEVDLKENSLFVLGDHTGLPKKAEDFVLRFGEKISLGKKPYLAASCITIINYLLDEMLHIH